MTPLAIGNWCAMANAVFTSKPNPAYDDAVEERYHFPRKYLRRVEQTVGDWIVYYEPRRVDSSEASRDGRQSYFGMARVVSVTSDPLLTGHYYAHVTGYLEFPRPVAFRTGSSVVESFLRKDDGTVNTGAFQNAVRLLPRNEFEVICQLGLAPALEDAGVLPEAMVAETQAEYGGLRGVEIASRTVRDAAFSRIVRDAYDCTCAMTGLQLMNGGGRCEIEAAHIRPVELDGPDSPRNGIALSRTVHWMFDRGILSISDGGEILTAKRLVPEQVQRMLNPDGRIRLPGDRTLAPHKAFLRFHREHRFKGD